MEDELFSNFEQLCSLDLKNNHISFIKKNAFSNLTNLEVVYLSGNEILNFDRKFVGLRESADFYNEN